MIQLMFVLFTGLSAFCQVTTIYFETGQHRLSEEARQTLSAFAKRTATLPSSIIVSVSGHTDQVGNTAFNEELSEKRALEVEQFLRSKGVSHRLHIDWHGESQPLNEQFDDEQKAQNRRVELSLTSNDQEDFSPLKAPEVVSFSASEPITHTFKEGTKIALDPANFELENTADELELRVIEYTVKSDFVLDNLTTQTQTGQLLESKGMVHVEVRQNGTPVELKKGKTIQIDFPQRTEDDGTLLFNGQGHPGPLVWTSQQGGSSSSSEGFYRGRTFQTHNGDTLVVSSFSTFRQGNDLYKVTTDFDQEGNVEEVDTTIMENHFKSMQAINESTNLGWINCDRFYDDNRQKTEILVSLSETKSPSVLLVFSDLNSVMSYSGKRKEQYYFSGVPLGETIEIVVLDYQDKTVDFAREKGPSNRKIFQISHFERLAEEELKSHLNNL